MTFSGEDELAIHTVAAASYRILRDIKNKRGQAELADTVGRSLYYIASDFVNGKLKAVPEEIAISTQATSLIEFLADEIRNETISSPDEVAHLFPKVSETAYWRKFNVPANFLKHADKDCEQTLTTDNLENDVPLVRTITAYKNIMNHLTPEMLAFAIYYLGEDCSLVPSHLREKFGSFSKNKRRILCKSLIPLLRNSNGEG